MVRFILLYKIVLQAYFTPSKPGPFIIYMAVVFTLSCGDRYRIFCIYYNAYTEQFSSCHREIRISETFSMAKFIE